MTITTTSTPVVVSGAATAADGTFIKLSGPLTVEMTPPAPAPAPATSGPLFGFNDKVDTGLSGVASTLKIKPILGAKMFNTGMPSSFPALPTPDVTHPMLCFKPSCPLTSTDRAAITALAKSAAAAAAHPYLCAFQEQEHLGYTPTAVKAAHAEIYDLIKAAASSVKYGQCLQSYSASGKSANGPLSEWVAKTSGGGALDFYGFDTYPWSATVTAGAVLDASLTELHSVVTNPTFAITELNYTSNIVSASIYSGGGAQWFSEAWAWAQTNKPSLFWVFAATGRNVPWPPDAATITELSNIAHATGL